MCRHDPSTKSDIFHHLKQKHIKEAITSFRK